MAKPKPRVYCSGPLFNEIERDEMREIADALESRGLETFLPHRDGLEFTPVLSLLVGMGLDRDEAHSLWEKAIFALDVYQAVSGCEAMVVNLNGRVPDEGAIVEAALARCTGKVMVGYKNDLRSLHSGRDNPMVSGLFDFRVHVSIHSAVSAVEAGLRMREEKNEAGPAHAVETSDCAVLGRELWEAMQKAGDLIAMAELLKERLLT